MLLLVKNKNVLRKSSTKGKCNAQMDMRKGFSLPKEHSSKTKYSGSKRNPSPHLPAENCPVRLFFSGQGTENALMWNFSQTKVDGCDYILQIPPDWEAAGELEQWHLQVKLWTIKHKEEWLLWLNSHNSHGLFCFLAKVLSLYPALRTGWDWTTKML